MRVQGLLRFLAGAMSVLVLAACGSGSDGTEPPPDTTYTGCLTPSNCGNVIIAVTDADGDFLSYTVDVQSLTLKRANGDTVETLPVTARIDFSQVVDLTEFLTSATVPNGAYVEGSLRLDYRNATVTVESNGQPVSAQVVGADGNPLGIVDVRVVLDNRNHLTVAPGRPSMLALDFDLAASNDVDLTTSPATVTATPSLVASLEPTEEKDFRLRGALVSVDTAASNYVVDVRPFNVPSGRLGQVTVHTHAETTFEVNGTALTGVAGLQALAAAGAGTQTIAFGTLTRDDHRFEAADVYAGTSVPGAGVDTVLGTVLARSGNELTVRGGTVVRGEDGSATFVRDSIKVRVSSDTRVLKEASPSAPVLGGQAISVGQRVQAFGSADQEGGSWVLDATEGRVRMQLTQLRGTVNQIRSGAVNLDLDSIDGRAVSAFAFAGTGATVTEDSDPDSYDVSTGSLGNARLSAGNPVRIFGFVSAFGSAPPDFQGRSVVDLRELSSSLTVSWGRSGTALPFSTADASGLIVNLQNPDLGERHTIRTGWSRVDLLSLSASPQIVPAADRAVFVIVSRNACLSFRDFAEFAMELDERVTATSTIKSLTAHGIYDRTGNVLRARSIIAIL